MSAATPSGPFSDFACSWTCLCETRSFLLLFGTCSAPMQRWHCDFSCSELFTSTTELAARCPSSPCLQRTILWARICTASLVFDKLATHGTTIVGCSLDSSCSSLAPISTICIAPCPVCPVLQQYRCISTSSVACKQITVSTQSTGHSAVPHLRSSYRCGHPVPPLACCVTTERLLECIPPPQKFCALPSGPVLALQLDQGAHWLTLHSMGHCRTQI